MCKVRGAELGAVNVVERADELARLRAEDDPFMFAMDATHEKLEGKGTRPAGSIDDPG